MTTNPVDYAIISQGLVAIAREMGFKLVRSAYSTVLREARDGSAALLDIGGNTVAQAELIPIQLGTIGQVFRHCLDVYPVETFEEGDFAIINDPYSGGQHLQDVFIFSPIFFEGQVIGFSASCAHHIDVSGGSPGMNSSATDVYGEGIIIPPLKLNFQRDWDNGGPYERFIRANVRVPHQTMGDFDAQFAANAIGAARLVELANRYGREKLMRVMQELQTYSEVRMRAAIREVPDGVYYGEDFVDDDGAGSEPLPIRCKLTVAGDTIHIDFDGTADQVGMYINSPFAATVSSAVSAVKAALTSPDIPFNAGAMRPITVSAPLGCILNPRKPAPVRARLEPCLRAWNATMHALSEPAPTGAVAPGFDTTTGVCLAHLDEDNRYSVLIEVLGGGAGGAFEVDGCHAIDAPLANCANTPIEAMDQTYSFFRIAEYALRPDSCGGGRWRGGLGFTRAYEILKDGVELSMYSDRYRTRPRGFFGGADGTSGYCRVERGADTIELPSKGTIRLSKGDVVVMGTGGGAGYGPAAERSPEAIRDDLANGIISSAPDGFQHLAAQ